MVQKTKHAPKVLTSLSADGKVYAAFVATGKVKLSTPNKTETFNFTEGGGKREHGFILSEVSASSTNNVTYRSDVTDVETNYNLLEAMTFDNNNLYVAGTFNQPAVFGVEKKRLKVVRMLLLQLLIAATAELVGWQPVDTTKAKPNKNAKWLQVW